MAIKINNKKGDNPKLEPKAKADGTTALRLKFYFGRDTRTGKQIIRKETLHGLNLITNPRTPFEREQNRQVLLQAEQIRHDRQQQLITLDYNITITKPQRVDFISEFSKYIDNYKKGDKRVMVAVYNNLCNFLQDYAPQFVNKFPIQALTKDFIISFVEYLQDNHTGEGAHTYYARFKKFINYCIDHDMIIKNPCKGVTIKSDQLQMKKDILTADEIEQLAVTACGSDVVKRAFLFSCFSGLRFCDVSTITFASVDYSRKTITFRQAKTGGECVLSYGAKFDEKILPLIGTGKKHERIFNLPSSTACNKDVQRWVNRAGIDKHITWHCARHSYGTNLLTKGANIKVVADLLGHSNLQMVERYVRATDKAKQNALESIL
ncbi:tyrosine-type recombinase/integrase [Sodaliphilus sp.]|uniref:tyrosine-type recombinase/integrase n=1 Tax=Sodaliphilus sp. TaxID=2815818 RepID=UPI00389023CA